MKLLWIMELIIFITVAILVSLLDFSCGETYTVDVHGNGDFNSLDDAVSAAEDNDIIMVETGNHTISTLEIEGNISIIGNGKYNTNITQKNDTVIHLSGKFCHVANMSFRNVKLIVSGSNTEIYDMLFINSFIKMIGENNSIRNSALQLEKIEYSSGLFLASNTNISNVSINEKPLYYISNQHFSKFDPFIIDTNASAVFLFNTSNIRIENNDFINNIGIRISDSYNIEIRNNIFRDIYQGIGLGNCEDVCIDNNVFLSVYYGILIYANTTHVVNNTFTNNTIGIFISNGDGYNNVIEKNQFNNSPYQIDEPNNYIGNNTIDAVLSIRIQNIHGSQQNPIKINENCSSITLDNCSYILIHNITITSDNIGINLMDCNNITILNCSIQSTNPVNRNSTDVTGIFIDGSTFITVEYNDIDNYYHGIVIYKSSNNSLQNNSISNNYIGINLAIKSKKNILESNIISSIDTPLVTNSRENNVIRNNSFYGTKIELSEGNTVENNELNEKTILYFYQVDNITINPIIFPQKIAMVLIYSCSNVNISNINISDGYIGLHIEWSNNITIQNNIISNHTNGGVDLLRNSNLTMLNNTVLYNKNFGIQLRLCLQSILASNHIAHNQYGIRMEKSSSNRKKTQNKIISNKINNNSEYGLYIDIFGDYNVIQYNNISFNQIGIHLWRYPYLSKYDLDYNVISYNQIINNSKYGLEYTGSNEITAFTNNWWGHKSGPYQKQYNPNGVGNEVKGDIHVNPWMPNPNQLSSDDDEETPLIVKICLFSMIVFIIMILIFFYSVYADQPKRLGNNK